tara:strand:+ start:733 stop:1629 length:897 start_codon:yes stop_codon:yes gene_type:complete
MKKSNSLDKLLGAAVQENKPQEKKSYVDERIWKPVMDKTGNGFAIIRFLPAPKDEELPWVKLWNHAFQGPTGQWYIENSLTTISQNDPVSELNTKFWNSGVESDKEIARKQKRKLQYYSNIYVVKDSANPENEGKVFLYRYGKKIFDKVMETMQPAFEDETPVNPFDFWEGANFKLKLRKVDGYWNYDKSEFETPSALAEDDAELEAIWGKQYSLSEFTAPSNFKSYDELQTRLNTVLSGTTKVGNVTDMQTGSAFDDSPSTTTVVDTKEEPAPTVSVSNTEDDDDTMSYFEKLAEEG